MDHFSQYISIYIYIVKNPINIFNTIQLQFLIELNLIIEIGI